MRILLDTHTLLCWLDGDRRLSRRARGVQLSEACFRRKLPREAALTHTSLSSSPIAQAEMEDLPIVTNETLFDAFGITRIW